jgi:hypothetical protein
VDTISFQFNTSTLPYGVYVATITVAHNDLQPLVGGATTVAVTLTVERPVLTLPSSQPAAASITLFQGSDAYAPNNGGFIAFEVDVVNEGTGAITAGVVTASPPLPSWLTFATSSSLSSSSSSSSSTTAPLAVAAGGVFTVVLHAYAADVVAFDDVTATHTLTFSDGFIGGVSSSAAVIVTLSVVAAAAGVPTLTATTTTPATATTATTTTAATMIKPFHYLYPPADADGIGVSARFSAGAAAAAAAAVTGSATPTMPTITLSYVVQL